MVWDFVPGLSLAIGPNPDCFTWPLMGIRCPCLRDRSGISAGSQEQTMLYWHEFRDFVVCPRFRAR